MSIWHTWNMTERIERSPIKIRIKVRSKKEMETATEKELYKIVTMQVFDLKEFDTITLGKQVKMPEKPSSLNEVVQKFGNDEKRLINIIYEGMCKEAELEAEKDKAGWHEFSDPEEGELADEEYSGRYADPEKKKLIRAMILNFAKVLGFDKSKTPDEKRAAKEQARKAIMENQAMLNSISQ